MPSGIYIRKPEQAKKAWETRRKKELFVNIVYEVYEKAHKNKIDKDLNRQKEIEDFLKCKLVIIEDNY